jgi:hypothetical protein
LRRWPAPVAHQQNRFAGKLRQADTVKFGPIFFQSFCFLRDNFIQLRPGDQISAERILVQNNHVRFRQCAHSELPVHRMADLAHEPFPRGSLVKYLTPERDREQLAILKACVQVPE